ncbi:hypothetical protein EIN_133850 [Entamoeba invadens IP1]|uniref:Cysteine protease n=2 Tax=Entamoeba invadens TaxID=33085 RepID=A0A0A1U072_ENTIV|nr:hypothetical protein EIN_133850 [Entamoeba invadens IP1]ELP85881.1 hypothetical protein EIN_133850 [Entamoeba invadens IP1]BAN41976.1 hypothetical protein [Entamoeba invadens]|eukprot:XP_004185227.1 hypothetical protein EIN_133850 [Entamoeba invadens IP1]
MSTSTPQKKKQKSFASYVNACSYNLSSHFYNSVIKSKFEPFAFNFEYTIQGVKYVEYPTDGSQIAKHLSTLFKVTYRNGFTYHLPHCSLTTDAGWGCTIRSVQMLFLNSLIRIQEPDPGFDKDSQTKMKKGFLVHPMDVRREYVQLIEDTPRKEAVLSIHKMFDLEVVRKNNQKGTNYLSPSTCATAISVLMEQWDERPCHVMFVQTFPKHVEPNTILMVLAPLNERTQCCLDYPFVSGVVCGVETRAIYVVGHSGGVLLLLDPHHVQKAHEDGDFDITDYSVRTKDIKMVGLSQLAFGNCIWSFLVRDNNLEVIRDVAKTKLGVTLEEDIREMKTTGDEEGFEVLEF